MNANTNEVKKIEAIKAEIAQKLKMFKENCGIEGRRFVFKFRRFMPMLKDYALQDLGTSQFAFFRAALEMLNVRYAEAIADVGIEFDFPSFQSDIRAFTDPEFDYKDGNDNTHILEKEDVGVDDVLSSGDKEKLYKMCFKVADKNLFKYGASRWDVQDIASGMYVRVLSKRVSEFKRGLPKCEAEWRAFLRKDAEFARMNFYKKAWRHPTVSLDERIEADGHEDEVEELTRMDALDYDAECVFQPNRKDGFLNTPESKFEIQFIPAVCAKIGSRSSARAQSMLRDLLLDDATVKEVSSKYGIKANAIYAAKKRFMDALRDDGEDGLAQAEACAA